MVKPSTGPCQYCRVVVLWPKHKETGKTNPLDLEPSSDGNALLDRQRMRYEFLTGDDLERAREQKIPLYVAHRATCVNPPKRHGGAARRRAVSRV